MLPEPSTRATKTRNLDFETPHGQGRAIRAGACVLVQ
jgi:hypothetical protein